VEATDYLRFLLVLVLVIGLIMALGWGLKRVGIGGAAPGLLARKRLRTVESATIDSRYRVVLVRRDAVEHLVLIGPTSSQVIETGIPAPADDPAAPPSFGDAIKSVISQQTA